MENNFEKQVQQKMEELSLTPSMPVWAGIQAAIRRRRDRRRVVLWLLPLLLLGGGISYLVFEKNNQVPVAVQQSGETQEVNKVDAEPLKKKNREEGARELPETNIPPSASVKNTEPVSPSNSSNTQNPLPVARGGNRQQLMKSPGTFIQSQDIPEAGKNKIGKQDAVQPEARDKSVQAEIFDRVVDDFYTEENLMLPSRVHRIETDAIRQTRQLAEPAMFFIPDTIALQKPVLQVKLHVTPKWQWGIAARAGVSATDTFSLQALKGDRSRFAMDPALNSGGSGSQPRRPQSEPRSGIAFSVAVYVKRNLGARLWLESGLQYSYYSTRMTVGTKRRDTAINSNAAFSNADMRLESYYRNDANANWHTNKMHYLELPLLVGYRPLKNIPLQLRHGATVGRLIGGSHLQYNTTANIYYESEESLRRMQWHLLTSAEYRVVKAGTFAVFAGPELQYGLSTLRTDGLWNRLFFGGLKTRIEF